MGIPVNELPTVAPNSRCKKKYNPPPPFGDASGPPADDCLSAPALPAAPPSADTESS